MGKRQSRVALSPVATTNAPNEAAQSRSKWSRMVITLSILMRELIPILPLLWTILM
jgi:hypothetical protein